MKISIIIPAYNEEKRIGNTLKEFSYYFKELKNKNILEFEIIIVINNTTDKTEEIVKKYSQKYREIKYLNLKRGGKGYAIIEGFKDALKRNNDLIGFVDADLATGPEEFYDLVKNINNYDGIIASRYVKGAVVKPKQSLQRIIVSRIFNYYIRFLFMMDYNDTQCGAKLFKRMAVEQVIPKLIITKWAFDVDLLYSMKIGKFNIKELPTTWSDKEYSKINFVRAGPLMALSILRLRILNSPFKGIIKIYDKVPEWAKVHHKI